MLRARASFASASAAAAALEALFIGKANVLVALAATTTSIFQSSTSTSATAAFSSSCCSQQISLAPWKSRGECDASTSTDAEGPIGFCREEEPALIMGGRHSELTTTLSFSSSSSSSSSLFAASSFQHSLWQQQRRWMAVPKKKVRGYPDKEERKRKKLRALDWFSIDGCFFSVIPTRPRQYQQKLSETVLAPPPRDAQLGQVRPQDRSDRQVQVRVFGMEGEETKREKGREKPVVLTSFSFQKDTKIKTAAAPR